MIEKTKIHFPNLSTKKSEKLCGGWHTDVFAISRVGEEPQGSLHCGKLGSGLITETGAVRHRIRVPLLGLRVQEHVAHVSYV